MKICLFFYTNIMRICCRFNVFRSIYSGILCISTELFRSTKFLLKNKEKCDIIKLNYGLGAQSFMKG